MDKTFIKEGRALKGAFTIVAVTFAVLLASCGGADAPGLVSQQQEEAAALNQAMQIARETNAAKVRGERAKVSAASE